MAGKISMGAQRAVVSAVTERYRSAKRAGIASMRCAHFANTSRLGLTGSRHRRERSRKYGATIKDALTALWEASDRVCGKRLKVMIPILLPALEQHGRLKLGLADRDRVLAISPPKGIVRPRMGSV